MVRRVRRARLSACRPECCQEILRQLFRGRLFVTRPCGGSSGRDPRRARGPSLSPRTSGAGAKLQLVQGDPRARVEAPRASPERARARPRRRLVPASRHQLPKCVQPTQIVAERPLEKWAHIDYPGSQSQLEWSDVRGRALAVVSGDVPERGEATGIALS